jgi:hypothetical protein
MRWLVPLLASLAARRPEAGWRAPLLVACLLFCSAAAWAELYKCQGADGKMLFTSDRSQCPGAAAHEPGGEIQRTQPSGPARAPTQLRPAGPAAPVPDDAAEAQVWRAKRAEAVSALHQTEARLATARQVAGWCNRGHEVFAEDPDGLRHDVSCEEVDATEQALRREQKRLEAYLGEGLEEECRRAGCLPGWLR